MGKLYTKITFSVRLRRCEDTPRLMTDYKKQAWDTHRGCFNA
jgi:hypothetical protein